MFDKEAYVAEKVVEIWDALIEKYSTLLTFNPFVGQVVENPKLNEGQIFKAIQKFTCPFFSEIIKRINIPFKELPDSNCGLGYTLTFIEKEDRYFIKVIEYTVRSYYKKNKDGIGGNYYYTYRGSPSLRRSGNIGIVIRKDGRYWVSYTKNKKLHWITPTIFSGYSNNIPVEVLYLLTSLRPNMEWCKDILKWGAHPKLQDVLRTPKKIPSDPNAIYENLKTLPRKLFKISNLKDFYKFLGIENTHGLEKHLSIVTIIDLLKAQKEYNFEDFDKFVGKIKKSGSYTSSSLYLSELYGTINRLNRWWLFDDYLRMCTMSNVKPKLNISLAALEERHNELQRVRDRDEIQRRIKQIDFLIPSDKFKKLKSSEVYEVEFINSPERLVKESQDMGHCVWSYHNKINNGECGIYSILDKLTNKRYTCELINKSNGPFGFVHLDGTSAFNSNKKGPILLNQLMGKHNTNAPEEVRKFVEDQL